MLKTDQYSGTRPRCRRLPCSWQRLALDLLVAGYPRRRGRSRHSYLDARDVSEHLTRAQSGPSSCFHGQCAFTIQAFSQVDPTTGACSGLGSSHHASDPLAYRISSILIRRFGLWGDIPPIHHIQRRIQGPVWILCISIRARIPRARDRINPRRSHFRQPKSSDPSRAHESRPRREAQARVPPPAHDLAQPLRGSGPIHLWLDGILQGALDRAYHWDLLHWSWSLLRSGEVHPWWYSAYKNKANLLQMPTQLYLIELFGSKGAASALSANNVLRYMGGTFLPLAGPGLYRALDYGWGNTLLGFLALVFALPPVLFYKYGERLRAKEAVVL